MEPKRNDVYLVGFNVVHSLGNSMNRAFMAVPNGRPIDSAVILEWEAKLRFDYQDLKELYVVRVFSFQKLYVSGKEEYYPL